MDLSQMTDEQVMSMTDLPAGDVVVDTPAVDIPEGGIPDEGATENAPAVEEQQNPGTQVEEGAAEGDATDENAAETLNENASTENNQDTTTTDAAKQLAELFEPFIANGKELKIDNIADAKRLMQMGAGFNKKMATLKPHLKIVKLLEQNGLLDQDKLNHLIDVSKKNPAAISKLLADSNIDPLNLNVSTDYKPTSYTVDEVAMQFDDVISDLKDSPHYLPTLQIVADKWDDASKQILFQNPEIIRVIHDQQGNGIYAKVSAEVERQRALGNLTGLSDIHAYKQVGDDLNSRGAFGTTAPAVQEPTVKATPAAAKPADNPNLKSRKLAASPTKAAPSKQKDFGDFNPLTATDAEIMAMSLDKFL